MEEYAIYQDYKKVIDYNNQQRVNGRLVMDADELEYWNSIYPNNFKPDPESEEPF